ncbi:MobC family plasmid mobilization relaxosome protein [Streptomyces sp. IBSBF 2435]|uniref:MobC family plasmid mobilization relaxosome protein n=1 Tax=Streptomyces sp. IBSBF 2435 TaxID=2903531 RepID=UPI003FA764F8
MSFRNETPAIPTPRTRPVRDETSTAYAHSPNGPETTESLATNEASCAFGHSPVGGAPCTRSCAPGVTQDPGRQGATGTGCGAEGGPASRTVPTRTGPQRRTRTRQNKQRDAVSVRLSTTERTRVKAAADHTGASLAKFMAQASLAAAHDINRVAANLLDLRGTIRELIGARTDLARIGNNINQIARAINSGGGPIGAEAALADVRRVAGRLETAAQTLADRA